MNGNVFCTGCEQRFSFFLPKRLGSPEITIMSCREKHRELRRKKFLVLLSDTEQYLFLELENRVKLCKGRENEELVVTILQELQEEGRIRSFYRQDSHGVDFVVIRVDGEENLLQVKSSPRFVAKHQRKHPNILVVGVYRKHKLSPQLLKEEVANALSL